MTAEVCKKMILRPFFSLFPGVISQLDTIHVSLTFEVIHIKIETLLQHAPNLFLLDSSQCSTGAR